MQSINPRPLQDDLPFGARISGVTPDMLDDAESCRQLNTIFEQYGMIVFEDVEPSSEFQITLSNVFGPLKEHPVKTVSRVDQDTMPGVIAISNTDVGGIVEIDGRTLMSWQPWHFDHSYNNELNRAGVLRSVIVPPEGGLTGFADGIQIYHALPASIRERIEPLNVIYSLNLYFKHQRFGLPQNFRVLKPKGPELMEVAKSMPRSIHPAVWTRPDGEKVLHMSPYGALGFEGMETGEGDALFEEAWSAVLEAMRPYHHEWKETDMLIWDNWRMLHEAPGCSPEFERIMHRTTIKGDYGLGRFEAEAAGERVFHTRWPEKSL